MTITGTEATLAPPAIPRQCRDRWRPSRAGLINVWRYHDEILEFHRGRLLLRGANGSGKSMALELLFPFLLDANASQSRLSSGLRPRGGLYERLVPAEGSRRVGFLWAEFTRPAGDGVDRFTIGVRLSASSATRKVDSAWFTTRLAVGEEVYLLDDSRTPLSRAALIEVLGDRGVVHPGADEYRTAVRTTLFSGFSSDRYDAFINALLALRREKISQDLNASKLSDILTASLPPLDEHDITEIADGFEKLDRRRDNIARLEDDLRQVKHLARRYGTYAGNVLVARAKAVRAAETRRDDVTRSERHAKEQLEETERTLERIKNEARRGEARMIELDAEIDTLEHLDAYGKGSELDRLRSELGRIEDQLEGEGQRRGHRERDLADAERALDLARGVVRDASGNELRAKDELEHFAGDLGAAGVTAEATSLQDLDEAETMLGAWADSRREQLASVRVALRRLIECITGRDRWDQQVEADRDALSRQVEHQERAEDELVAAVDGYAAALRSWLAGCEQLGKHLSVGQLASPPEDPAAVDATIDRIASGLRTALAVEGNRARAHLEKIEELYSNLEQERHALIDGRVITPPAPEWRTERGTAAGVPLWQLVDFSEGAPGASRDRLEAGLLASGLLDALVEPDGRMSLSDGSADAVIGPWDSPVSGPSLADALVPLEGAAVPVETTNQVLARIGLVDSALDTAGDATEIGQDGSFHIGALRGRGPTRPAGFIGAAAQADERARRVTGIEAELGELARQRSDLEADLDRLNGQMSALDHELDARPEGAAVTSAAGAVDVAAGIVADSERRLRASEAQRSAAEHHVRSAQRELMRLSAHHSLPADDGSLDQYEHRLTDFERHGAVWARRGRDHLRARRDLEQAQEHLDRQRAHVDEVRHRHDQMELQRADVAARLNALQGSLGSEYEDIVRRIEAAAAEHRRLGQRRSDLSERRSGSDQALGGLRKDVAEAERKRAAAEEERDAVHRDFVAAVSAGMADDAGLTLGEDLDGISAILAAARSVVQDLASLQGDDRSLSRAHTGVLEAVHTSSQALGGRVDISFEQSDREWWLLRTSTDGIRRRVHQLVEGLASELELARDELKDEEQRLFDETLTGSVREAVANRIRTSNELVDQINAELSQVRTAAASVQVRLRWEVDPEQPEAVRAARRLLLKNPADLGQSERAALHDFFRARMNQVRADLDAAASWDTRLRQVLDYRLWHRFALEVAHRDWDGYVPATTNRLQRLSTGERSIALHLPMLASIAAHYDAPSESGASACPRLILLDELFAGVDIPNRAQLFGLLVSWDLDAVLTSDHEWCAHATLDGIAIHHLHTDGDDGEQTITTSRFVWDGNRRIAAPVA